MNFASYDSSFWQNDGKAILSTAVDTLLCDIWPLYCQPRASLGLETFCTYDIVFQTREVTELPEFLIKKTQAKKSLGKLTKPWKLRSPPLLSVAGQRAGVTQIIWDQIVVILSALMAFQNISMLSLIWRIRNVLVINKEACSVCNTHHFLPVLCVDPLCKTAP